MMQAEQTVNQPPAHSMYRGTFEGLLANVQKCAQVCPTLEKALEDLSPNGELSFKIQWGRGATCDHTSRVVTLTMGKCACHLTQELVQEVTNMSFAREAAFLNSAASNGDISRDTYVKTIELTEFLGVRNVVKSFDALGETGDLGCEHAFDKNGAARTYVQRTTDNTVLAVDLNDEVFNEYFNADFLQNHKERIGERYYQIAGNNGWSYPPTD